MKTKKDERTVAAILSMKPHGIKGIVQQSKRSDRPRHTYIYCRSTAIAKRFLADTEKEGFLFADGKAPTAKETSDIFALMDDFTICYTGIVAHMHFGNENAGNVRWIDYGKYVCGEKDFQAQRAERTRTDKLLSESLKASILQNLRSNETL